MFDAFKEKAQRASAAAGAAVRQGVDAARQGVTQGVDAAKGAVKRASEGGHASAVDADALEQLIAMGFARTKAEHALTCVGGKDVAAAATLLCSEGNQERTTGAQVGATARSSSGSPPQERLKEWVEVHGLTTESGKAMNGRLGQIVEYDEAQQRYLVDIDGECKLLRAENLRGASTSDRMKATMQAGLKSAKDSVSDVKKKAEALFSRSVASSTTTSAHAIAGGTLENTPGVDFGPTSVEHRRAAAEAAERRLVEARARNAGTMDDYRRLQREQAMARSARLEGRGGAEQQPRQLVPQNVIGGEPDEAPDTGDDEGEDMQRALAASLSQEQPAEAAAQGEAAEKEVRVEDEDLELQRALAASLGAAGSRAEGSASPPGDEETALGAAAPAAQDAGDLLEQDPELFELRLRQAMAEEELELQQALAASLAAEREALENAVTSAPPDEDSGRAISEVAAREKRTRQDCEELEQELVQVKCQVAEHGEPAFKEPEVSDASVGDAPRDAIAEVAKAEGHEAEAQEAEASGTAVPTTEEVAELPVEVVEPAATTGTAVPTEEAAEAPAATAGTTVPAEEAAEAPEEPAATAGTAVPVKEAAEAPEEPAATAGTAVPTEEAEAAEAPEEPAATAGTAVPAKEAAEAAEAPAATAGSTVPAEEAAEASEEPAATAGEPLNAEEVEAPLTGKAEAAAGEAPKEKEADAGEAPKELKEAPANEGVTSDRGGEEGGTEDAPAALAPAEPAMQATSEEEMMFAPPARTEASADTKAAQS